ncbi:MAG: helix-turn-helix domain-containing protein [Bacteroidota bacterium]
MTLQDLQQIATKSDLLQLKAEIGEMLDELRTLVAVTQASGPVPTKKPFYSPKEFGALIGVSRQTVMRWAQDGTIKAVQKGGKRCLWLVPHSELERLQEEADDLEPQILN